MERFVILRNRLCTNVRYHQIRNKSFKNTLNNPNFPIPMRKNHLINSKWEESWNTTYHNQLKTRSESKAYVLHDGPPYANGYPHMGHALNKILKDVTVRFKMLQGYRVHYRPGWDCHGLPIEIKASGLNPVKNKPDITRKKAQSVAEKFIGIQGEAFRKWGVMGDWSGAYRTLDHNYQATQLRAFSQLYQKGLVNRGLWPVHWSYSSQTALAEAELEYNEQHKSPSIHVAFKTVILPEILRSQLLPSSEVFLIIWTTTPWTLVSNEAVAVHPDISYQLCYNAITNNYYICSSEFVDQLGAFLGSPVNKVTQLQGSALTDCRYEHPLTPGKQCPVLAGSHVTTDKGTGLVHVAPCHGRDDFELGQKMGLPLVVAIDERAVYTDVAGPELSGFFALTDGSQKIIDLLGPRVVHQDFLRHSYPYDWRSKQPVITLVSSQWFLDTAQIKEQALAEYDRVEVYPASMKGAMRGFIADRPRWCISRQRVWGVPIPVFFHKGQPVVDHEFISSVADRVSKEGSDFWWNRPLSEFLPASVKYRLGLCDDQLEKSSDIFDIWMDSGLSWLHVLGESGGCADLYLEGQDQFRGWFSSSLLLSTALTGKTPFRRLAVHGFTTDEAGLKMSKSLGNVVSPDDLVSKHGVDVLRYWAASAGLGRSSSVGDKSVGHMAEKYRALRNMFRFLLGNLSDFTPTASPPVPLAELTPLDRYLLHHVAQFCLDSTRLYTRLEYDQILPRLEQLSGVVSNLYFTAVKDRLYCDPRSSRSRLSAQTALHVTLTSLTLTLSPLLPYLTAEVQAATVTGESCGAQEDEALWSDRRLEDWTGYLAPELVRAIDSAVLPLRGALTGAPGFDPLRVLLGGGGGGTNPAGHLRVDVAPAGEEMYAQLRMTQPEEDTSSSSSLCELLRCASVTLLPPSFYPALIHNNNIHRQDATSPSTSITALHSTPEFALRASILPSHCHCPRCRRYTIVETEPPRGDELCGRCEQIVVQCSEDKVASSL